MVRITRDGVTYHPDQLDRKTGEPLTSAAAASEPDLSPAQAAAADLEDAGAEVAGVWWTLPVADEEGHPVKVQGAVAALARLRELEG